MLILDDTNDEAGSVETVGKEEKGSEVGEGVSANQLFGHVERQDDDSREPLVLFESAENLLPAELNIRTDAARYGEENEKKLENVKRSETSTHSQPVLSLGDRGARTLLLKEEPGEAEQYPVEIGEQEGVLVDKGVAGEGDQNRKIERQSDNITP